MFLSILLISYRDFGILIDLVVYLTEYLSKIDQSLQTGRGTPKAKQPPSKPKKKTDNLESRAEKIKRIRLKEPEGPAEKTREKENEGCVNNTNLLQT